MESLGSGAGLSGVDVIESICCEIAAALATEPDLRESDSHERFSARVDVQLTLHGVDEKKIARVVEIGPASPSEVRANIGLASPSLELPTSPEPEPAGNAPVTSKPRRWYAPRQSAGTTIK